MTRYLHKARPWVQGIAFALFLYLVIWAGKTALPEDLFFLGDPLTGVANMLAARRIVTRLLIGSAIAVLAAVVMGRAWCGWLCPLGTLLDWVPSGRRPVPAGDATSRLRSVKYVVLAVILIAAWLGNATLLFLDPLTLIYRTVAVAIWPAFNALIYPAEVLLYKVPLMRGPIDAFETTLRGLVLPAQQPFYALNVLIALIFAGVVALNAIRPRFWCRYLCPLGGLLGMISRVSWLRRTVGSECIECGRCSRACPTGTIDPGRGFESDPAECIMCLECVPTCPHAEQTFVGHLHPAPRHPYDLSRRQFVAAAGGAVSAVALFGAERAAGHSAPHLIRPPGADSSEFLSRCIRCGICLKVCPTSGLQPSLTRAGWAGIWTPVLVPRLGHCDYSCHACGEACPTGAIPRLTLAEKRQTVIGHAYIDRDRCLPWADNRTCLVCEEMCPLPDKAIVLEEVTVTNPAGATMTVRRPHVLRDRCIGCGICENRCPLAGDAAIRVYVPTDLSSQG